MKGFIIFIVMLISSLADAQSSSFPIDWIGNWKGELLWYKTGKAEPQKVNMELRIQPADSSDTYTWHLIYGTKEEDYRPYILKLKNIESRHWVIDELSGIVLDQFWSGNKFSGSFKVQNSTITNSYWMENDKLNIEFYNFNAKALNTSGKGTDEIPFVDSYQLGSYQKAVLIRTK